MGVKTSAAHFAWSRTSYHNGRWSKTISSALFPAEKLSHFQISLEDLNEELAQISKNSGGGFIDQGSQEILVRNIGAISSIKDIENTAVASHFGRPIRIGDIAVVKEGTQFNAGEASYQRQTSNNSCYPKATQCRYNRGNRKH